MNEICPICDLGKLIPTIEKSEYNKKLDLHFSICSVCGSEQANSSELSINKKITLDFNEKNQG